MAFYDEEETKILIERGFLPKNHGKGWETAVRMRIMK